MKTFFGWLLALIISASCSAQVNIPMGGTSPPSDSGHKTTHFTSRSPDGKRTGQKRQANPRCRGLSEEHEDAGDEDLHIAETMAPIVFPNFL